MKKITIIFIIILLVTINNLKAGSLPTLMLEGVSAEEIGVANISSMQYGKIEYMFHNPAVINGLSKFGFFASYIPWLFDTKYIASGLAYKMSSFSIGAGAIMFSSGDFENILLDGTTSSSTLEMSEMLLLFDFSKFIIKKKNFTLSAGGNFKYIKSSIAEYKASSFSIDTGVVGKVDLLKSGSILFGASVLNIGKSPVYVNVASSLPFKIKAGVGYKFNLFSPSNSLLIMSELLVYNGANVSVGMEYSFLNMVFLRAGYSVISYQKVLSNISIGAGIQYFNIKIDYALKLSGEMNSETKNILSIGYKL